MIDNFGLHRACEHLDVELVKKHLSSGSNPNLQDEKGQSSLHIAVDAIIDSQWQSTHSFDNLDFYLAIILIQNGANTNLIDNDGKTVSDWVQGYGIEVLKEYQLQLNMVFNEKT